MTETAQALGVKFELRPKPIYSSAEADAWLADAKTAGVDGLMLVLMDRQQHTWPTAYKAVDTGIPTVIFSPVGTSFTTNTAPLAKKPGCVIYSVEEFDQALYGMKMLEAGAKVSLPCIAWSRMNDEGIPAAYEADYGALASHIIVQYLFGCPGFQQDPVADTVHNAIIGAHCSSPARLNGFNQPAEPFDLVHHHGNRDAVPRTLWRKNQHITCIDVLPGSDGSFREEIYSVRQTKMLILVGTVLDNVSVPPNGGCVVSVRVKFDGNQEVLDFPGFHQLFFYGDYRKQLEQFCQLFGFKGQVV